MGRKQLKEDYAKAVEKFSSSPFIKDLQFDPETICFSFEGNNKSTSFTLYIGDEYPEGTTLYPEDGSPKYYCESLSFILEDVCAEYGQKFGVAGITKRTEPETNKGATKKTHSSEAIYEDPDEDEEDEDTFEMSSQLQDEMAAMRAKYGTNVITERTFGSLDLLNLDLHVFYPFYTNVASAWGVQVDKPITVRMQLSPAMYLNSMEIPKIDILQDSQMCGLSTQLSFIVKNFCSAHWTQFANAKPTTRKLRISATNNKFPDPKTLKKPEPKVKQLMDMGFTETMAQSALEATDGNVEHATNLLLESPSSSSLYAPHSPSPAAPLSSFKEHAAASKNIHQERKDIFLQEKKDTEEQKFAIEYSGGFLAQLHKYVMHRIPTLNKFCIICDRAHLFASSHLLRPAVCARELCCFAFQNLGVCAGATDGIATQAEVVDLLVCMAKAAAGSTRKDTIFDPYPTVFDPLDSGKMVLNPQKKDFTVLDKIFRSFPSVEDMTMAQEAKDMKEYMDNMDSYSFPLLQWIINSNRSHIEKLHPSKHLKSMNTPHQYVLITAPPEKEAVFSKLKEKHGTTYAFHGSPVENWHCILRTGLRNASGTSLQLNGAAYGKGIYLSPNAGMSFGYSQRSNYRASAATPSPASSGKSRFLSSSEFYCVALCEVANIPDIKKNGDIWVCPEEDPVVTRFFFVFPHGHAVAPTAHTTNAPFLSEISQALKER